ncbi:2'-5' RNA ligase family protein [Ramlibacter tataouinensis]|uniref:2'-5' RNA ligase family protein n=1 Tax=Ramlibacter tataouinensis TaxID=94132 RepID=UPI0022F37EF3|nr:2'-5' RNA ligase family protein [Ramlibacter tataouinensis]WBY01797.1 2'-5' RNA ligase family protein [Ramlibacter tataouinensis]
MATLTLPAARLFLALWPDDGIRRRLQRHQQGWTWPAGAAPVRADQLHLTLHFLGNVPLQRLDEFADVLAVEAQPVALDLQEGRPTVWPGGIAVLEFTPTPALLHLHGLLAASLATLGWPAQALRWRPHVTLARKAAGAHRPAAPVEPAQWKAGTGYALVRSIPAQGYRLLRSYGRASS